MSRGWFRYDRALLDGYDRAHDLWGDLRLTFEWLVARADDRTGAIRLNLGEIAEDIGIDRKTLGRRLARLERLGVVLVERSHAASEGAVVIVDYAQLDPTSRLGRAEVGARLGRGWGEVGADRPNLGVDEQDEHAPIQKDRSTEPPPPLPVSSGGNGLGPDGGGGGKHQAAKVEKVVTLAAERQLLVLAHPVARPSAWKAKARSTLRAEAVRLVADYPDLDASELAECLADEVEPDGPLAPGRALCDRCQQAPLLHQSCPYANDDEGCPLGLETPR